MVTNGYITVQCKAKMGPHGIPSSSVNIARSDSSSETLYRNHSLELQMEQRIVKVFTYTVAAVIFK